MVWQTQQPFRVVSGKTNETKGEKRRQNNRIQLTTSATNNGQDMAWRIGKARARWLSFQISLLHLVAMQTDTHTSHTHSQPHRHWSNRQQEGCRCNLGQYVLATRRLIALEITHGAHGEWQLGCATQMLYPLASLPHPPSHPLPSLTR